MMRTESQADATRGVGGAAAAAKAQSNTKFWLLQSNIHKRTEGLCRNSAAQAGSNSQLTLVIIRVQTTNQEGTFQDETSAG